QAAGKDAVGGDADAQLRQHREDLGLGSTADDCVFDLQIRDRVHRVRATDRICPDLGEPDRAHVTCLDQVGDGANRLLDGDRRIQAAGTIDIDVIDAEPSQAIADEVLYGRRAHVHADPAAVRPAQRAELDG